MMRSGRLTDIQFGLIEARIEALSGVHTACERIANTPLPFAYTLLVYRTAWLYCLLLPVGLTGSLGWATPVVVALVGYTFFGLDALGDELEEPFGTERTTCPSTRWSAPSTASSNTPSASRCRPRWRRTGTGCGRAGVSRSSRAGPARSGHARSPAR